MSQEGQGQGAAPSSTASGQTGSNGGSSSARDDSNSPAASSSRNNKTSTSADPTVDLAQALRDLARGEKAANSLEAELDKFDRKLNDMLTSLGVDPKMLDDDEAEIAQQGKGTNGTQGKK